MTATRLDVAMVSRTEPDFALELYSRGLIGEEPRPQIAECVVDDMGDVVADLRARLQETVYREPRDAKLLVRSMDTLARALAADKRPRKSKAEELAHASAAIMAEWRITCPYEHDGVDATPGPVMLDGYVWDPVKKRGVRVVDEGPEGEDLMAAEWRGWEEVV